MTSSFRIWLTLMTEATADLFVARLVHHGWFVEPLDAADALTQTNEMSCLLAVHATYDKVPDKHAEPHQWAKEAILKVIAERGILYHSLIVEVDPTTASVTWMVGNIKKLETVPNDAPPGV